MPSLAAIVDQPSAWDLRRIDDELGRLDATVAAMLQDAGDFAKKYHGNLRNLDNSRMATAFAEYDALVAVAQRASSTAEMMANAGHADARADDHLGACDDAWAALAEVVGFFEGELADVDVAGQRLACLTPGGQFHWFHQRVVASATAAAGAVDESSLVRLAATGVEGWQRLARQLLGRLAVADSSGAQAVGAAVQVLYQADATRRRSAHRAITAALEQDLELRATTLAMIAAAGVARADILGGHWLDDNLAADQLSAGELEALLGRARSAYPIVHDYYRLKRSVLGLEQLFDVDRYAPLPAGGTTVSWSAAVSTVLDAFGAIHPDFAESAGWLIKHGHVDAMKRPGKSAGASTKSVPGDGPYISLGFSGTLRSVLTLAHELGHGVHMRASESLPVIVASAPTVVAETVAIFFETMTLRHLLRRSESAAATAALAGRWMEDQLVAVCRHAALHDFEVSLRDPIGAGQVSGATRIGELWLSTQRGLYGDSVKLTDDYRSWWSYLEYLYLEPGSAYSHLYGQLAAAALVARFDADPVATGQGLTALMLAGGDRPPRELLRLVGLDSEDPAMWAIGVGELRRQLSDLSLLLGATTGQAGHETFEGLLPSKRTLPQAERG